MGEQASGGFTIGQTGSLMNYLESQTASGEFSAAIAVGDGATEFCWSDRHAWTVVAVTEPRKDGRRTVTVQQDRATRVDRNGMSESQRYRFEPNPDGPTAEVTWQRGAWHRKGDPRGNVFRFGHREEYHDYSF